MKLISFMLSNKCLVASYISPLEPKIIKFKNKLPIQNFSVRSLIMYVAIALRPTAYFHPLNTWIPLFFIFSMHVHDYWVSKLSNYHPSYTTKGKLCEHVVSEKFKFPLRDLNSNSHHRNSMRYHWATTPLITNTYWIYSVSS